MMLGETIRRLHLKRGIGQEKLGYHIGVTKQSISNWENDNITLSIVLLLRLADYFSVTTDYLLGRDSYRTLDTTELNDTSHIQHLIDDLRNE